MRTITLGRGAKIQPDPEDTYAYEGDVEIRVSQHPDTRPDECELVIECEQGEYIRGGRTLVDERKKTLSARGEPVIVLESRGLMAELRVRDER